MLLLVTGARGAIGRAVVRAARLAGHRVVGLGHGAWTGDHELPAIDCWINGEIDADNLSSLARSEGRPDNVVHLAGGSLVGASIAQPAEDFRRTVESSQRLLEWLRVSSPETRLVMASSAAVYGNASAGPIREDTPLAPASPYGTHKAMTEMMAASYARQFGLRMSVLRFFSVYGPGLRKQLVWDLTRRLVAGERDLVLGGSGAEQRDFLHIDDAAGMLLAALDRASCEAPIFNGATGRPTRVAEIADMIVGEFQGARVRFSGVTRQGDPASLVADATKARTAGLVAPTTLEEGLRRTVAWISRTAGREVA